MKHIIVTGCAGFIGSNIVDRVLKLGYKVVGIDNLSTGQYGFLEGALRDSHFKFINLDLLNLDGLKLAFTGGDTVIHLAANADVRFGTHHPGRDLEH